MGFISDVNTYWLGGKPTKKQQTPNIKGLIRYDEPPTTAKPTPKVEPKKIETEAEKKERIERVAKDLLWDYVNKKGK